MTLCELAQEMAESVKKTGKATAYPNLHAGEYGFFFELHQKRDLAINNCLVLYADNGELHKVGFMHFFGPSPVDSHDYYTESHHSLFLEINEEFNAPLCQSLYVAERFRNRAGIIKGAFPSIVSLSLSISDYLCRKDDPQVKNHVFMVTTLSPSAQGSLRNYGFEIVKNGTADGIYWLPGKNLPFSITGLSSPQYSQRSP
jgi:hypothetical protein